MNNEYDIFISYRRDTGVTSAQILKSELTRLGYKVFLDTDDLPHVGVFDNRIYEAIASAPVFLFVYSKGCLDRCVNADDWIALEITRAVELNRIIIPLNEDSALKYYPFPPKGLSLPEKIRNGLGQHQFLDFFTGQFKRHSIEDLKAGIESLQDRINNLRKTSTAPVAATTRQSSPDVCCIKIRANEECMMLVDSDFFADITPNVVHKFDIPYGSYFVEFTSAMGTSLGIEEYTFETPTRTISVTFPNEPNPQPIQYTQPNRTAKRLVLLSAGPAKLQVVKCVKELLGIGLKEAKEFVDGTPSIFPVYDIGTYEYIKRQLEDCGATLTYR